MNKSEIILVEDKEGDIAFIEQYLKEEFNKIELETRIKVARTLEEAIQKVDEVPTNTSRLWIILDWKIPANAEELQTWKFETSSTNSMLVLNHIIEKLRENSKLQVCVVSSSTDRAFNSHHSNLADKTIRWDDTALWARLKHYKAADKSAGSMTTYLSRFFKGL